MFFASAGAGVLNLTGNNTYTGTTTVNAGTVLVQGQNGALQGKYIVNGGQIAGGGTISQLQISRSSNASVSPGNGGPGVLKVRKSTLFAASNLAVGYTFSTVAQNQLQAVQLTFFFFLPNFLLSGFAFPFRGMPHWAQWIGEVLPLTHFIRIVRGIMLKGNGFADMQMDVAALAIFMFAAMGLALFRFRKTLD